MTTVTSPTRDRHFPDRPGTVAAVPTVPATQDDRLPFIGEDGTTDDTIARRSTAARVNPRRSILPVTSVPGLKKAHITDNDGRIEQERSACAA